MHSPIGFGYTLATRSSRNDAIGPGDVLESAQQAYAAVLQRLQIEVGAAKVAARRGRSAAASFLVVPRRLSGISSIVRGEPTGRLEPPEAVHAPVAARHPGVPADARSPHPVPRGSARRRSVRRKRRRPPRARRQGKRGRVAVRARSEHLHTTRDAGQAAWQHADDRGARWRRRHDGHASVPLSVTTRKRAQPGPATGCRLPRRSCSEMTGARKRRCVAFQVLNQLASAQVAVGIGSGVAPARQPGHPVRSEQVQRVPALATPALRHLTPVEHDVITSGVGQQAAHG